MQPSSPGGEGTACSTPSSAARLLTMLANLAARKDAPARSCRAAAEVRRRRHRRRRPGRPRGGTLSSTNCWWPWTGRRSRAGAAQWIAADGPVNRWRLALGYLLAEQGKLAEAIALFEAVAAADELGPAEYRTLADWYMAVDRREDHERCADQRLQDAWRNGG